MTTGSGMTLEDFAALEKGQEIYIHYYDVNIGCFQWRHDRVEGDSVFGSFRYDEDKDWSSEGDYLYEFMGYVCRGSGAEVCRYGYATTEHLEQMADQHNGYY